MRLLRDEIDEVDEDIFSHQKEKDEKERLKQEALSHKIEEENKEDKKEEERKGEEYESGSEDELFDEEEEEEEDYFPEEVKHSDKMTYKVLLKDFLTQKLEDIKFSSVSPARNCEKQYFDEIKVKRTEGVEKPRVKAVYVSIVTHHNN